MKSKLSLLMATVLLLGLLPTAVSAAPPKPPYLRVRDWMLPVDPDILPIGAWLSAWDINWRIPNAATVELGYKSCKGSGLCVEVVDSKVYTVTKDDKYPQQLDLKGVYAHVLEEGSCTLQQFVRMRDRNGVAVVTAWSQEDGICIDR